MIYNIDSHKLMYHPQRVAQWQSSGEVWELAKKVYPLYVEVSPMGGCNHRCKFCGVMHVLEENAKGKIPSLDGIILRERLREMGKLGVKSVMFAGEGEPLLHKETNANVCAAKAAGLDIAFTTNGILLNKLETIDLCSWVKVSVNAGTRETYAKVHQARPEDWDRVWRNIEEAAKRKGKCQISVQMVILPENQWEQQALHERATAAGVDLVIFKAYSQARNEHGKEYADFMPAQQPRDQGAEAIWRDPAPSHERQSYDRCRATPNFWAYLSATGDVYSCSAYLLDERFIVGNVNTQSFREIWEGDKRKANWEMMKTHDISECRLNCRLHKGNEYLADLENGVPFGNFV